MKPMDKLRKSYEEVRSPKKRSFLQIVANLSVRSSVFFGLCWDALRSCDTRTMKIFTGNMTDSWLQPISAKSQGCGTWMDRSKVIFL